MWVRRTNGTKTALRADTKEGFVFREAGLVVFVRMERYVRTNVTKAALRADTKGCFVFREADLVVFVRRNIRLAPISAREANRTVVWVHAECREQIEQSFGSKQGAGSKSNSFLAPPRDGGHNRTVI